MEPTLLVLTSFFVITVILIFYFFNKKFNQLNDKSSEKVLFEWLKTMQASLESTNKTLNESMSKNSVHMVQTLQENSKQLNERLDKAALIIREVGKEVGAMSEIGRGMKELQDFLKSPKLRGSIGEEVLKDLISQMFPKNSFHLQYQFHTGDIVDAVIKTDAGILPIDSKFPMENFQRMAKSADEMEKKVAQKDFVRDIKKHIDAISKKYILPDEGTMDFALMYVPSESVYYELVNLTEIMNHAKKARVYIVSPSTLYAHLQTILLSFEGKRIESRSREVFKMLRSLQVDYEKIQENMGTLGKHINNASTQFGNVQSTFLNLGTKLSSTRQIEEKVIDDLEKSPVPAVDK